MNIEDVKTEDIEIDNVMISSRGMTIDWDSPIGFGSCSIYPEDGVIKIDNEHMDKKFLKKVFTQLVEYSHLTHE